MVLETFKKLLPEKVAILNVNLFSIKIAYIKKVVF
jgi:hypothetical protein